MARTVAVVGGGIAGLTVAYELRERAGGVPGGLEVICLQIADRPGGNIRTDRADGFTCEWGPNGFLDNEPATLRLADPLGLGGDLVRSSDLTRVRWIVRDGRLRRLPVKPPEFIVVGK